MSHLNLVLLFAPAMMCSIVNSLLLEVKPNHPKCISEDIKDSVITVGNYQVVNPFPGHPLPDTHKITVRVRSPSGNGYHYGDNVFSGDFSFTATESGDYTTCFSVLNTDVTIDFLWKFGVAAKDWSGVPKKSQIDQMELELKKLHDTAKYIYDEIFYLREREIQMHDLTDETNSKIFTYSFFSILVCLSVAGLQLWHLKSFFEKKKIL